MKVIPFTKCKNIKLLHHIKYAIAFDHKFIRFILNGKLHNSNYYALYSLNNFDFDLSSINPITKQITYKYFYFNNQNINSKSIKNYLKISKYLKRKLKLKLNIFN